MDRSEIVVGVDGSRAAQLALRWAAVEAGYRNAPLIIAHAGDLDMGPDGASRPTEFGRTLMVDAQAEAFDAGFEGPIHLINTDDSPETLLTEQADRAALVVVGSHGLGPNTAALIGSVAFRVAAHADCPVAVVPASWEPRPVASSRQIAVGIGSTPGARAAAEYAFAEAERRNLAVRAVRSYFRPDWTATPSPSLYLSGESYEESQQALVEAELAPLRREHPAVPATVVITGRPIHESLAEQSRTAELLVIGSRLADGHRYSRLGPTARRLLHESHCPVIVVGHPAAHSLSHASAAAAAR